MKGSVIIIGVSILVVAGILIGVGAFSGVPILTTNVGDEAEFEVQTPGNTSMTAGVYEIWIQMDPDKFDMGEWERERIEISDDIGNSVEIKRSDSGKNFFEFYSYGEFSVQTDGRIHFESDSDYYIHITEPMDGWGAEIGIFCLGVGLGLIVGFIGIITVFIGILIPGSEKKKGGVTV
jgi:hypothetical protein